MLESAIPKNMENYHQLEDSYRVAIAFYKHTH